MAALTPSMPAAPVTRRIEWRMAEVVEVVAETAWAKSIVLRMPGWPGHVAGQHVDLRLTAEDGYQAQRSYSIASPPERAEVVITVERLEDGEVSTFLTDVLAPGDRLEVRGPLGGYFTWRTTDGGPLFLVAGGSGVVPLMAMLRHRSAVGAGVGGAAGSDIPSIATRLLYSSRSEERIIYREELERLAAAGDGLEVVHTLTRSAPPGWTGYTRRIDAALLAETAFAPDLRPRIFVCGPTALVEATATALVALGHDAARVKTERFGPTGG